MIEKISIPSFLQESLPTTISPRCSACTNCNTACVATCQDQGCTSACERSAQCGACQTACQNCQKDCEWVCQNCQTGCLVCLYCQASCELNCQNCVATCESSCEKSCQSTCEKSCQSCNTCQSTCQRSCQSCNTCQTVCQSTCQGQHVHSYTSRYEYVPLNAAQHQRKNFCSCGTYTTTNENHSYTATNYYYSGGNILVKCNKCSYIHTVSASPLFAWDSAKTRHARFVVTAAEMNKYITLLNQKVRAVTGNASSDIAAVAVNGQITAALINAIRARLTTIKATGIPAAVSASTPSSPTSTVSAAYMNQLVASLNSIR